MPQATSVNWNLQQCLEIVLFFYLPLSYTYPAAVLTHCILPLTIPATTCTVISPAQKNMPSGPRSQDRISLRVYVISFRICVSMSLSYLPGSTDHPSGRSQNVRIPDVICRFACRRRRRRDLRSFLIIFPLVPTHHRPRYLDEENANNQSTAS